MAKKGGEQTVTQKLDPQTEYMQRQVYGSALGAAGLPGYDPYAQDRARLQGLAAKGGFLGQMAQAQLKALPQAITPTGPQAQPVPGVDPLTQQAIGTYQGAANLGMTGMNALGGDQDAFAKFWNPYQSTMLDAMNSRWGDLASQTTNAVNDQATKAGAFGGSRHGIAQGTALAEMNKDQANQMAALQYQGFNDAMGRAGAVANLGMGANAQLAQLGEYQRQVAMAQDPAMRNLQILQMAMGGTPHGGSTSQPVNRNAAAGFLGGAGTGAEIGSAWGPLGTGIGAGLGGLIGLFG